MSKIEVLVFGANTSLASILATVFDIEIAKNKTSFLAVRAADIWLNNSFSDYSSNKALDLSLKFGNCNFCLGSW